MTGPTHDYVGVSLSDLVYVIVADREKFDKIALPETVHTNGCVSKRVGTLKDGDVSVVFQWWPPIERRPSAEAAP